MKKCFALVALSLLTFTLFTAAQQDKSKRPSPPAKASCKFADGKTIQTDYSSPRTKGRKVFGGLVGYGEVWRTGANESTTLVTNANLAVGGKDVPAGSYTIFTLPTADKWTLIISKKTGEWGTDYPGESNDLARVDMEVAKTPSPVENFTIAYEQKGGSCVLTLSWENTQASVEMAEKK
jgi:hypothetical protein